MPIFKSTYNILSKPWEDEVFDPNWMDSDKLVLPPKINWDYSRELQIEDVDVWEVIFEATGPIGVYAAWLPHAEFYLLLLPPEDGGVITFYGKGAQKQIQKAIKNLNWPIETNKIWVDVEDMWLYE